MKAESGSTRTRRWIFLSAATLACVLPSRPGWSQDEQRIEWLNQDFPPFSINQGPASGQGISDVLGKMIQDEMSAWTHVANDSTLLEVNGRMRDGHQVCATTFIKTPTREKIMHFSIPFMIVPPNGITIRREDRRKFGDGTQLAQLTLAQLIEDPSLKLAFARGRAYGKQIDAVLDGTESKSHVYGRHGDDLYGSLFEMLLKGSTDYILGFPYEAVFRAHELGVEDQVMSLPIAESGAYVLSHIVCAKTEWGAGAVQAIDTAIRGLRTRDDYRQAIERWLDESLMTEFRKRYRQEFLTIE